MRRDTKIINLFRRAIMNNGLSVEFKTVPSIPILAVSADGLVVHVQTGRTIAKHINDEDQEFVVFYTYDPAEKKNEVNVAYLTDLIEETYGVKTKEDFDDFEKVPSEEFISVSRDGRVRNSETGFAVAVQQDENDGPFVKIYDSDMPFKRTPGRIRFVQDMVNEAFSPKKEPETDRPHKMIRINNVPIAREALLQIQRTKGRSYPGPLRDQIIWDLIDYLVREVDS